MNRQSSRSHAIFVVKLKSEERLVGDKARLLTSTLNLVDLAGSERLSDSKAEGTRKEEAISINESLTVLLRVIGALASTVQVPSYRDSKLTHFLKESLGGNSRTALIATIHADPRHRAQTKSTLQFASGARQVTNKDVAQVSSARLNPDTFKTEAEALKQRCVNESAQREHLESTLKEQLCRENAATASKRKAEELQRQLSDAQSPIAELEARNHSLENLVQNQ
ncbi:kinesin family member 15 [Aphelenchoides avenae]|nr:kinesin family member 15 [Aphelenchus avenae]